MTYLCCKFQNIMNKIEILQHTIVAHKMTEELMKLYNSTMPQVAKCISCLNEQRQGNYISNPYLIAPSYSYFQSMRRIMIVGQETYCWLGEILDGKFSPETSVETLMKLYDLFSNNQSRGYNSPYWNLVNLLQSIAKENGIGVVTNNLAKVGFNHSTGYDPTANAEFDMVFREEIRICEPDAILFLSGPNYDNLIRQRLGDFFAEPCIDALSARKCARLNFPNNTDLSDMLIFRTYHPGYLQRVKNRFVWAKQISEFLIAIITNFGSIR